jgi:hypothetical protein
VFTRLEAEALAAFDLAIGLDLSDVALDVGRAIDGANRNDIHLLEPTIKAIADNALLADIDTLHLDRGYDYPIIRDRLAVFGLTELDVQRRGSLLR